MTSPQRVVDATAVPWKTNKECFHMLTINMLTVLTYSLKADKR